MEEPNARPDGRGPSPEAAPAIDGCPEELIRSYVFYNADTYLAKFRKLAAGRLTFHWPAFFVCNVWFAYRRMYAEAAILTAVFSVGLPIAETLLVFLLGLFLPPPAVLAADWLFLLAANVAAAMAANPLYFRFVKRQVDLRLEEERVSGGALNAASRLGEDSPTSVGAVFAFLAINFVANLLASKLL